MDLQLAKDIKAQMVAASPLVVTVANGQKVLSKLQCLGFKWSMQGYPFQTDLRIIRLEGSGLILGIDWLRSYGQVTFDFQQNATTISREGQQIVLRGIGEKAQVKVLTANQWYQEYPFGECCVLQQCNNIQEEEKETLDSELSMLLDQYHDIFEEPKGLPPQR